MTLWRQPVLGFALLCLVWPATPASAQVRLAISHGQVSLSASNATVRQILAEWARVGHTTIVNGDRVNGGPITLELSNVSEIDALEVILRSVSGYVLAPRRGPDPNASVFDRILIVPTSNAVRVATSAAPAAFPQPQVPAAAAPQPDDDVADDVQQAPPPGQPSGIRGGGGVAPTFSAFPQPRVTNDQPDASSAAGPSPVAPAGVPTPGMFLPAPPDPQSQQPGAAGRPTPR